MAGEREPQAPCAGCEDAVHLDQLAIIDLEGAEVGVLACDRHLRRLALALNVLEALETVEEFTIPPLVDVAFFDRLIVKPNRPDPS